MPDLGGPYTVVRRLLSEALVKNDKRTMWTVVLRNKDGHAHTITSKSKTLWDQYPFGAEVELSLGKEKQTKLAVKRLREKDEGEIGKEEQIGIEEKKGAAEESDEKWLT